MGFVLIENGAQVWIGFGSVLVLLWIQFGVNFGLGLDLNQVTIYMFCLSDEFLDLESFWTCFGVRFGFGSNLD